MQSNLPALRLSSLNILKSLIETITFCLYSQEKVIYGMTTLLEKCYEGLVYLN